MNIIALSREFSFATTGTHARTRRNERRARGKETLYSEKEYKELVATRLNGSILNHQGVHLQKEACCQGNSLRLL